jgi:hypothetical protein
MGYEITLERVEAAMMFMAETDEPYAVAVTELESSEIRRKRVRARMFLSSGGTVAERNAEAEVHDETVAADEAYAKALLQKETLKARRQRAELVIELYRTLSANQRRGS